MTQPGSGNGFQSFVNNLPAPGVAGDFAGANIRANVVASLNGFVATAGGVVVGQGCWADPTNGVASSYYRPNSFMGFVHRNMQALITAYLGSSGSTIQDGDPVTAMAQGDFWGLFSASATAGQKVYFNPVTGALTANATGNGVSVTISAGGASISSGVLTTTDADVTGTLAVGQLVTASGGSIPPGTYIASADGTGSGTHLWNLANADGATIPNVSAGSLTWALYGVQESQFYVLSPVTADASITATLAVPTAPSTFGVLTVSAVGSGTLAPGQWISSSGTVAVPASANIQIIEQLTGTTGSTGTYLTNNTYYAVGSGQTFAATQGKVGKISSWANQL